MKCPYCGAEVVSVKCEYCDCDVSFLFSRNDSERNIIINNYYNGSDIPKRINLSKENRAMGSADFSRPSYEVPQKEISFSEGSNIYYDSTYYAPPDEDECSEKSRSTAIALCVVSLISNVGGLHRFYAGKVGSGILYFFTGNLFWIGGIIDLIKIVSGKFTDKDGKKFLR